MQRFGPRALGWLPIGVLAAGALTVPVAAAQDTVDAHLAAGRRYLEAGEYARAVLEFEQVLRFENLPPDLREQAEIYAGAAEDYAAGRRLSAFGYAETGGGFYRENVTRSTAASGDDPVRDWFWKARIGGGLAWRAGDDWTLDATLDYRFRYYDDTGRRDDSDLRWLAAAVRALERGSATIGVRGRASYRGADGYRQDYGLFVDRAFQPSADTEIAIAGEIRSRQYPPGSQKERSRDIGELWLRLTHALLDGRAAANLVLSGGREWATHDRPDGDNTFYGVEIGWSHELGERLGYHVFGLWEHNGYHGDLLYDEGAVPVTGSTRSDDTYELGAGLTYAVAPGWSLRPEILYERDESNVLSGDYSSTEIRVTVRKSF